MEKKHAAMARARPWARAAEIIATTVGPEGPAGMKGGGGSLGGGVRGWGRAASTLVTPPPRTSASSAQGPQPKAHPSNEDRGSYTPKAQGGANMPPAATMWGWLELTGPWATRWIFLLTNPGIKTAGMLPWLKNITIVSKPLQLEPTLRGIHGGKSCWF